MSDALPFVIGFFAVGTAFVAWLLTSTKQRAEAYKAAGKAEVVADGLRDAAQGLKDASERAEGQDSADDAEDRQTARNAAQGAREEEAGRTVRGGDRPRSRFADDLGVGRDDP